MRSPAGTRITRYKTGRQSAPEPPKCVATAPGPATKIRTNSRASERVRCIKSGRQATQTIWSGREHLVQIQKDQVKEERSHEQTGGRTLAN